MHDSKRMLEAEMTIGRLGRGSESVLLIRYPSRSVEAQGEMSLANDINFLRELVWGV